MANGGPLHEKGKVLECNSDSARHFINKGVAVMYVDNSSQRPKPKPATDKPDTTTQTTTAPASATKSAASTSYKRQPPLNK